MIWTIVMDLRLKYKKGQNMRARLWLRNQKNVKTIARFWIRKSKIQKRILWFRCMIMRALGLLVVVSKSSLLISTTFIILLKGVRVITVGLGLNKANIIYNFQISPWWCFFFNQNLAFYLVFKVKSTMVKAMPNRNNSNSSHPKPSCFEKLEPKRNPHTFLTW